MPTDDRHLPVVDVAERNGLATLQALADRARHITALLHGDGGDPGQGLAVLLAVRHVADDVDGRVPFPGSDGR